MRASVAAAAGTAAVAMGVSAVAAVCSRRRSRPTQGQAHDRADSQRTEDGDVAQSGDFDERLAAKSIMRMSSAELAELREAFLQAAGRAESHHARTNQKQDDENQDPGLDRTHFVSFLAGLGGSGPAGAAKPGEERTAAVLQTLTAGDVSEDHAGFIFELFDTNRDGRVSLREFLCGLSILCRGSKSDRLRYLFYMYDADASGTLCAEELLRVIRIMRAARQLLDSAGKPADPAVSSVLDGEADFMDDEWDDDALVENIMDCADLDGDGSVGFPEFEKWAETNRVVGEWSEWIGNVCGDALAGMRDSKERELRLLELARMGLVPDAGFSLSASSPIERESSPVTSVGSARAKSGSQVLVNRHPSANRDRSDSDVEPRQLDPFEIDFSSLELQEQIGSGAFASVHRGEWLQLPVAVKSLHETGDRQQKAQLREDLIQEVALLTALRHPNIILYMGLCLDLDKPLCIVTELFPGGSLGAFLESHGAPSHAAAVHIALSIARGLVYLHSSQPKILHRDLKSGNILISSGDSDSSQYRVAICDFGLSQLSLIDGSQHGAAGTKDQASEPTGTAYTMAPEVINGQPYRSKSDVYSFGIILWEIFSGCSSPYGSMNAIQVMYNVVQGSRPSLKPIEDRGVPETIIALMKKCWAEDLDERPTFAEVAKSLAQIMKELTS